MEKIFFRDAGTLMRRSRSSLSSSNAFDALKGFFFGGGGNTNTAKRNAPPPPPPPPNEAMDLPPATFTMREFVEMFAKAEREGTDASQVNASGFSKIGVTPKQLERIAHQLTEEELKDPMTVGKRGRRLKEVANACGDDEITADKVKRVILAHATTKLMFGKIRKAVLAGGASLPKSVADFENIVRDLQKSGDMKREARNLKGAYSNNSPCPCNSGKRFKRCCGS